MPVRRRKTSRVARDAVEITDAGTKPNGQAASRNLDVTRTVLVAIMNFVAQMLILGDALTGLQLTLCCLIQIVSCVNPIEERCPAVGMLHLHSSENLVLTVKALWSPSTAGLCMT